MLFDTHPPFFAQVIDIESKYFNEYTYDELMPMLYDFSRASAHPGLFDSVLQLNDDERVQTTTSNGTDGVGIAEYTGSDSGKGGRSRREASVESVGGEPDENNLKRDVSELYRLIHGGKTSDDPEVQQRLNEMERYKRRLN